MSCHSSRCLLLIASLLAVSVAGCASGAHSRWQAWKTDCVDTVKAFSGTGEYLGASTQARDVERSLGQHRQ